MVERRGRAWRTDMHQRVTRGARRCFFTHVGIICNVPAMQPLLPQVIFVGAHSITQADWSLVVGDLPHNVYVKRMKKGWNNADQHRIIMRILGMILAPFLHAMQPILYFDAALIHLASEVFAEMTAASIWFVVIPARLTWLLQPLDTHGFVKYKAYLRRGFEDAVCAWTRVSKIRQMLRLVVDAIRHVLQARRWQSAFEDNGLAEGLDSVSAFIKNAMGGETLPALEDACPRPQQLELCWPRNRRFELDIVYAGIPGGLERLAALGYEVAAPPADAPMVLAAPLLGPGMGMEIPGSVLIPSLSEHCPHAAASTDGPPAAAVDPDAPAAAIVPAAMDVVPTHRLTRKTSFVQGG